MKGVRLWHWVGLRMSLLAIGAVLAIAFAMWVHFTLADRAMLQTIPLPVQAEFQQLRADPQLNQARLWQILSEYYPIDNFLGGLGNSDWLLLWLLVAASIPLILLFGFLFSHPLSRQFSSIAQMARHVAQGDFSTRLPANEKAPDELQRLIGDFNSMTTQLQGYEQEVRESSAMIAHELRTPLNAALGRVQGMLDEVFPRDLNQLELVKRQLDQLNKLVDDLHLLSLAKAGQLVLDKTRFNLGQLVHERLSWFNTQLHSASIEPEVLIPASLRLRADNGRMGQVINILIDNALRYAPQGGELQISALTAGTSIILSVADRGPGIDPADVNNIFDRFWRAERSRARHSGGSGLGLSIAKAICAAHGGSIAVANRVGGGAVIRIEMPA